MTRALFLMGLLETIVGALTPNDRGSALLVCGAVFVAAGAIVDAVKELQR